MRNLMAFIFLIHATQVRALMTPIEPTVAWDKKEIKVCWGNKTHQDQSWVAKQDYSFIEYSQDQKRWIKDIITQEYNSAETGISFTGWESCNERVSNADVILFRFEPAAPEGEGPFTEKGGLATVGQKGELRTVTDMASRLFYQEFGKASFENLNVVILNTRGANDKKVNAESYIQMLALHEFGHTAGLRHQHIRMEEAKKDPNCKKQMKTMKEEHVYKSTAFTSGYDHNSVMNYCYLNKLTAETGLKFRDKNSLTMIKMTDKTLYSSQAAKNLLGKEIPHKKDYSLRVGLSAQDKHALRCMYVYDDLSQREDCKQAF